MKKKNLTILISACCSVVLVGLCLFGVMNTPKYDSSTQNSDVVQQQVLGDTQSGDAVQQSPNDAQSSVVNNFVGNSNSEVYNNQVDDKSPAPAQKAENKNFNSDSSLPDTNLQNANEEIVHDGIKYTAYYANNASVSGYVGDEPPEIIDIPATVTSPETGKTYSVQYITRSVFLGCSGITSLTLPDSISDIGPSAFEGCSGITSLTLPDSITNIDDSAFKGCSGITSLTLPDSITNIGHYVFAGCSGITSLTLPDSITNIGPSAFEGCSGITSLTLPDSLTEIGKDAFGHCEGIRVVVCLAEEPPTIEGRPLPFVDIYVPDDSYVKYAISSKWQSYSLCLKRMSDAITEQGKTTFQNVSYTGFYNAITDQNFAIANGVDGSQLTSLEIVKNVDIENINYTVTEIKESAFKDQKNIETVTLPNSLTTIGNSAFQGCSGITSLTLPDSLTSLGESAFEGCTGVITLTTGYKNITNQFNSMTKLQTLELTDTVESIGDFGFMNLYYLQTVKIGGKVNNIGQDVFLGCFSLKNLVVSSDNDNLVVKDNVLYRIKGEYAPCIISVAPAHSGNIEILPDITSIPANAFLNSHATSIAIPHTVNNIGDNAFLAASSIKSMTFLGDKPGTISPTAFFGLQFDLYYPTNASGWKGASPNLGGATHINYKPMVNPQTTDELIDAVSDTISTNTNILISSQFKLENKELVRVEGTKNLIAVDGGNLKVTNTCFHVPANATLNLNGVTFSGYEANAGIPTNSKATSTGLAPIPFTEDELTASNDAYYKNAVIYNYGTTSIDNCSFADISVLYSTIFNSGTLNVGVNSSNPVTFSKCTSTYKDANTWGGGALYNNGEATLNNCVFENCSGHCGGAIHNVAKLKIEKSSFTGCTAVDGAAICNTGAQSGTTKFFGDLVLNDCTISGCAASQHGSAIVSRHDAKLMFDGICMIYDNGSDDVYLDTRYSDSLNSTFTVGNTFSKFDSRVGITVKNPKDGITVCPSIDNTQWSVDNPPFVSRDAGFNIAKQDNSLVYA